MGFRDDYANRRSSQLNRIRGGGTVPLVGAGSMVSRYSRTSTLVSDSVAVFEHLFDHEVSLCIWNREPDLVLARYLNSAVPQRALIRMQRVSTQSPALDGLLLDSTRRNSALTSTAQPE